MGDNMTNNLEPIESESEHTYSVMYNSEPFVLRLVCVSFEPDNVYAEISITKPTDKYGNGFELETTDYDFSEGKLSGRFVQTTGFSFGENDRTGRDEFKPESLERTIAELRTMFRDIFETNERLKPYHYIFKEIVN